MRNLRVRLATAGMVATLVATLAATPVQAKTDSVVTPQEVTAALQGVNDLLAPSVPSTTDADSIAEAEAVDVRRDGTLAIKTASAGDIVITLPYANHVPGKLVYDGAVFGGGKASATYARAVQGGAQVAMVIANASAPMDYPFAVSNGTVAAGPQGSLLLFDSSGQFNRLIPAPWARDAARKAVATRYAVAPDGRSFSQRVEHRATGVVYPVVADPYVSYSVLRWWPSNQKYGDRWVVYFDRNETGAIASAGAGAAVNVLRYTSLPGWAVTTVGWAVPGAAAAAVSQSGKCATLQVDILFGWLINTSAWVRNC